MKSEETGHLSKNILRSSEKSISEVDENVSRFVCVYERERERVWDPGLTPGVETEK